MEDLIYYFSKINSDQGLDVTIIRTVVTYIYAIFLIRLGNTRFRLDTPIDFIFIIIIGAVLGRTVYGGASLIATIASSFILMLLHKIFAKIAYKNKKIGAILKGRPYQLIKDGKIIWENMQKHSITEDDLLEGCHNCLNCNDLCEIKDAYLERNGKISFIKN